MVRFTWSFTCDRCAVYRRVRAFISHLVCSGGRFLAFCSTVLCIWYGVNYIKTIFGEFSSLSAALCTQAKQLIVNYYLFLSNGAHRLLFCVVVVVVIVAREHFALKMIHGEKSTMCMGLGRASEKMAFINQFNVKRHRGMLCQSHNPMCKSIIRCCTVYALCVFCIHMTSTTDDSHT